jgi:hypothetical protein
MKRFHEYEKETTETYYALGKGNKFLKGLPIMNNHDLCNEPTDAYTFVRYDKAKQFLTEYSKRLEGYKIYAITHVVKTETHYTVLDCDIYKEEFLFL